MSPYTEIDYVVADGVATLTLDRPARMNAFTGVMADEIVAACDEVDADDAEGVTAFLEKRAPAFPLHRTRDHTDLVPPWPVPPGTPASTDE